MGNIIDFLRKNVFWLMMLLAVAGVVCVHMFVARPTKANMQALKRRSKQNVDKVSGWSKKVMIPNKRMAEAATQEEERLDTEYGQMMLVFAPWSGAFNRDFAVLENLKEFKVAEEFRWWDEYEEKWSALLRETRERFDAPENVLEFAETPVSPTGGPDCRKVVQRLQREFWMLKRASDALAVASPEDHPLVQQLKSIRLVAGEKKGVQFRHPWLNVVPLSIRVKMLYRNVPELISALQNSPGRLMVSSYRAVQPGLAGGAVRGPKEVTALVDVDLWCQLIDFRPAVHTVAFSGQLFKDVAAVKEWLDEEYRELNLATRALLDRIPSLKRGAEIQLGGRVEGFEQRARRTRRLKQEEIEENAPARLEKMLKDARDKTEDGKIPPEQENGIKELHKEEIARKKEQAQRQFEEEIRAIPARAGGFALVYDHLYPLIPQKAYFSGQKAGDKEYLAARAPDDASYGGRWWIAKCKEKSTEEEGEAGKTAEGDATFPKVKFVSNTDTDQDGVSEVIVTMPDGGGTYEVLKADGQPISLSDTAFRFAHLVNVARRAICGSDSKKLEITPQESLAPGTLKRFEIPVKQAPRGRIKVEAGLRR